MGDVGVDWSIVGSIKSMPSVESVGALVDVVGVGVKSDVGSKLNFSVVVSVNLEGSVIRSKAMGMVEIGVVWCGLSRLIGWWVVVGVVVGAGATVESLSVGW